MDNRRNMFLAFGLSMIVVLGWTFISERYFPQPKAAVQTPAQQAAAAALPAANAVAAKPRAVAVVKAESPRIAIETPTLKGSINLKGARIDDLVLSAYHQELPKTSPSVVLYAPEGTAQSALAGFGWVGQSVSVPAPDTLWQADGTKLTPETPVTLTWDNKAGQVFSLKVTVDKSYMFSVTQSVANHGAAPIALASYAYVSRNHPAIDTASAAHVGPVGAFNGKVNYDINYVNLDGQEAGFFGKLFGSSAKAGENNFPSMGGWVGFGDKYWLSAIIPDQNTKLNAGFRKDGAEYRAGYAGAATIIAPNATQSTTAHLFSGAKEVDVVDGYENRLGITHFGKSIDWGWFEIICKPFFRLIDWLFKLTGNFGVAIILTTFVVRLFMFPIAQRQFASMATMRVAQPKIKALQERHKDDKTALQQATMQLYKEEKINPVSGCLPIFLQIPVFYALYKVLSLSIEMRHQPFALWLHDLSAPDPMFFGLTPGLTAMLPSFLALGILPILLGITMWAMQKLNPAPTDPAQAQMMMIMPWMMMFFFAPLAAGLQLYYVVSNILTILQQRWLYSKHPAMQQPPAALKAVK